MAESGSREVTVHSASEKHASPPPDEIRIGISACILGDRVRFDGGHKRDDYIASTLADFVTFVPVCPEVDIGLGTPREALRLVRLDRESPARLRTAKTGVDHTDAMRSYAERKAREIDRLELSGFILKTASPSCGIFRVKVYDWNGSPSAIGRGLFAEALIDRHPLLPVEEEGRLRDPRLRENFFERVFAYRRLRKLFSGRWSLRQLVEFHTAEKFLLLSHSPEAYRRLGPLVADAKSRPRAELAREYQETFMAALAKKATPRKHSNVLQHMTGFFKKSLDATDREELRGVIEDFRHGLVPLVVPITLIRHHVRKHGVEYLRGQTYLEPHPRELMLRNHV